MNKSIEARTTVIRRNPLSLGCWALGGKHWGGQSETETMAVMQEALTRGICHFDTAQAYGVSEKLVGRFIRDKREEVFLASKVYPTGSPGQVRDALHRSLEALQTDFIDLYYLHWPVEGEDNIEQVQALLEAREQGLIGAVGLSNFTVRQLHRIAGLGRIDFLQIGYHLLWRVVEEEIMPYCRENGIGVVSYSSLGQGILTGKFPRHPHFPKGDHRANHVVHFRKDVWPEVHRAVEKLNLIAVEVGRPLSHLALQWLAAQKGIISMLVGARNRKQVIENAAALEDPVDPAILEKMTRVSDSLAGKLPQAGSIFGK